MECGEESVHRRQRWTKTKRGKRGRYFNTTRLILSLQRHPRNSVCKLMKELQMSSSVVYRTLSEVSKEIDLYLDDEVLRMVR